MAATGAAIPTATNSDSPAANSSQRDRGRGRGGGRGGPRRGFGGAGGRGLADDTRQDRQRGGFGGDLARSRGQRGGRGRDQRNRAASQSQSVDVQNEGPAVVQQPTPQTEGVQDGRHDSTNGEEGEVCFICAGTVDHWAIVPCNHRTCHICALRSRALYKSKACLHCRTEAATVIFTDEAEKRYENFSEEDFFRKDDNLGIAYDKPMEIFEDTVLLLRYNCPDSSCDVACMGWPDLHRHVKSVHHKTMCDLCIRNKKLFTHEHTLFTQPELRKHEKFGDNTPGAIDQSGFEGHPECGFCRQRFYGEDELYAHCRDRHERCHLCDRRTGGRNPQYYVDYNALEQHFGKDHWPCLDNECLEKKFVVFDSEMDLKAHQLENHPNGLSKDARRDARRVDISSFDYRPQYQETRRGGRRAGRGRDPNAEGVPAVSSGHMSRAEVAHQRAREIQSAQSGSSRTFEGQLTQTEPQAQTVHRPAQAQSPRPNNALPHAPSQLTAPASPRPVEALTPQEQARRMRHAVVTERAANLLQNDQMKLAEFRERISAYRIGTISAPDLIDAFFSLFDTSSAELGKLIKELAEIFEVTGKRDALLKAWSDWKAINEDYPSLPGPAGNTSSASVIGAGVGSSRVLKLKSSTAQSSRSAMGQQQKTWGSAAASPGNPFPSLSAANGAGAKPAPTPGWLSLRPAAGASKSGSTSSSARPSPTPSRSQSSVALPRRDAFPALPAARKPTSSVFSPGYTGAGVIRQSTGSSANAWAGGGGVMSNGNGTTAPLSGAGEEAEIGKGKGKKKKDQAPKLTCNPVKLANITAYFQKSRVAHSIKDLEKHLPSVASINGMQVKDYLQALSDENKIHVEKIGSGNWYWSFASEEKNSRVKALEEAQTAHDKAEIVVKELRAKVEDARAVRAEEEVNGAAWGESRADLEASRTKLESEVKALQSTLKAYCDDDPVEMERKKRAIAGWRVEAEGYTDEIYSMEGWFGSMGQDEEALKGMRRGMYGDEVDEEEGVLKELVS